MLIAAVLAISLGYTLQTISAKYQSRFKNTTVMLGVSVWAMLGSLVALVIYGIFNFSTIFVGLTGQNLFLIFVNGTIKIAQIVFWIQAIRHIKLSIIDTLANFQIIIMTAASWILFADIISPLSISLIVLLFLLCILLSASQYSKQPKTLPQQLNTQNKSTAVGLLFLLLWILITVGKNLLTKQLGLESVNTFMFQFLQFFVASVVSLVLFLLANKHNITQIKQQLGIALKNRWFKIDSLGYILAENMFFLIITSYNVGLVQALTSLYSVFVIAYSRVVLKEKISWITYIIIAFILATVVTLGIVAQQ